MSETKIPGVYLRGTGVIGWPLASLLLLLKNKFGGFQVFVEPYKLQKSEIPQILSLLEKGAIIVDDGSNGVQNFFPEWISKRDALSQSQVVCDSSPPGIADKRKSEYSESIYDRIRIFIAQGSEHSFGPQFLYPESSPILENNPPRFIHVSTCNTHTLAGILRPFYSEKPQELSYILEEADFFVIRRDADMAKNDPHVTGPLLVLPESETGTHHGRLLNEVYHDLGFKIKLGSSSVTINSPYMHLIRFHLRLKREISKEWLISKINNDPFLSITELVSTNSIFSSGRDRGLYGRIFSHAVFPLSALEVNGKEVRGYAATPGDSNVHISTIYAVYKGLGLSWGPETEAFLAGIVLKEV
ncbi:hypothetical protein [Leptospira licerasiae]|uniref:Glyceraldehyde-3-phosphate dehydrogenase n=1 Tax=Leptospira licerasiae str. MMD4847 TaxID=1049971 RepID=A0ABN0H9E3_9LEPT|nr:hypothetical protein [Leptospira licerasiae]EIE00138.1 hypothetical protein LEP1GSC185_2608 [Leptospira licerasiae serovar Varillal str. VAR 010]EJZ42165.1 hypothetical protein LEP1GSC178_0381 [Leptospira licerasiae str. MMD4847]